MRVLSWIAPLLVAGTAATAWGQYGLYGSPEVLRLPQAGTTPADYRAVGTAAPGAWQNAPNVAPLPGGTLVQTAAMAPAGGRTYFALQNPLTAPDTPPVPAPPAGPGVVDQMLSEACAPRAPAAGCGESCAPAAAPCGSWAGACCSPCDWYFENNLMWMGRNNGNRVWTTYETNNNPNQLMNTDVDLDWKLGGEVRLGRRFCCGTWAVEGVYWGLQEFYGTQSMTNPNTVSTPLAVDLVQFVDGSFYETADNYFDGADAHYLQRWGEVHNVELNAVRNWSVCGQGGPWEFNALAGFRYFRFTDALNFWSEKTGYDSAFIYDKVSNDLYGAQIGVGGSYKFSPKWRLFADGKFGLFGNHMDSTYDIYRGAPNYQHAQPTPGSQAVGSYPVDGSGTAVSFLTEAKAGLSWNFWNNWSAQIGYRVVVVSNVAFAENQFLHWVVDFPELQTMRHNGDLILHGAFAGITWNF